MLLFLYVRAYRAGFTIVVNIFYGACSVCSSSPYVLFGIGDLSLDDMAHVQLSVVPEEMQPSSVALTLSLAADTAQLADESGDGVASTAATALVEIIGQVRVHCSHLLDCLSVSAFACCGFANRRALLRLQKLCMYSIR